MAKGSWQGWYNYLFLGSNLLAQRIIENPTVFDLKIRGFGLDLRQNEWGFAPEYGLRERGFALYFL